MVRNQIFRSEWIRTLLLVVIATTVCLSACSNDSLSMAPPNLTPSLALKSPRFPDLTGACTVARGGFPTPNPSEISLVRPVSTEDWVKGPANARLTFIEFGDYQCPYCARIAPILAQLQKNFPADVRIVYRHFPLPSHDKALISTQAAEAAGMQGKFWEMHELLYAQSQSWGRLSEDEFVAYAVDAAKKMGLDEKKFADDLRSEAVARKALKAQMEAIEAKIGGTPLLILNGRPYFGAIGDREYNAPADLENLSAIVRLYQIDDKQFNTCPEFTIDPAKQYTAILVTEKGEIVIQLFAAKAPVTVNSFVFLARQGWFDNTIFHRVVQNSFIQGGDPSGSGMGSPGYAFRDEISDLKFDKEGMVGMVNQGANTNGSQFFITLSPQSALNGRFTVFGQVIRGMEVARKLTPRDSSRGGTLPPGDRLIRVIIEEK